MSNLSKIVFNTKELGEICIICKEGKIYEVIIGEKERYKNIASFGKECIQYKELLEKYLRGIPLKIDIDKIYIKRVSPFYRSVYKETLTIPYGSVTTYKDIAERIGRPRAYRAVATALRKNPFPIFIPCHRVIRSDGKLGGREKDSFIFRKKLLELERREHGQT